jgi:DNA-binding transcriptional LysR family regulator
MHDLNDLFFYVQAVDNGGFAPAGRKLGMPKSKLSRRIALLEERLGVRLIQRSTRHFVVTEIGQDYYRHCVAMLIEAEAAEAAVERSRSEPRGIVRLSCPTALAALAVGEMVARFMMQNPHVQVHMDVGNRRRSRDEGSRRQFPAPGRTSRVAGAMCARSFARRAGTFAESGSWATNARTPLDP